jgi:FixJ family two-component response regulator
VLLSTAGIESRSYGSAEEYLDSTQLTEPACLLLDNQLPGMSGTELLKRIVEATPNSSVIMITGFGDVPTAVLAIKAGAFHFVQKPIDAEALLTSVEEAFSRADKDRDVQSEIAELRARYALLTKREQEVLALILDGLNTKLIACQLAISVKTAEHNRAAIMQKSRRATFPNSCGWLSVLVASRGSTTMHDRLVFASSRDYTSHTYASSRRRFFLTPCRYGFLGKHIEYKGSCG